LREPQSGVFSPLQIWCPQRWCVSLSSLSV